MRYLLATFVTILLLSVLSYGAYIAGTVTSRDYEGGIATVVWLAMCIGGSIAVTVCIIGPLSGLMTYLNRARGLGRRRQASIVLALTYAVPIFASLIRAGVRPVLMDFMLPLIAGTYFTVGYLCFWKLFFRKADIAGSSTEPFT